MQTVQTLILRRSTRVWVYTAYQWYDRHKFVKHINAYLYCKQRFLKKRLKAVKF